MNAPLNASFSLALALAAASPAGAFQLPTAKPDLGSSPAPTSPATPAAEVYGPPCPPTLCPGDMSATVSSLSAMAANDATPSVQQMEDNMLKGGTYSSIERDGLGNGAVITMPDGSIMYSDYRRGYDTIPKKPEELLADPKFLADNPAARAALVAAAQRAQQKEKDQAQICSSLNAGSDCAKKGEKAGDPGSMSALNFSPDKSAPTEPAPNDASDAPPAPAAAAATPGGNSDPDWKSMGNMLNPDGPSVASNADNGARDFQRTVAQDNAAFNDQLAGKTLDGTLGKLDPGAQGFLGTQKATRRMNKAIAEGTRVLQSETDPNAAPAPADSRRGSNFFGR